MFKSSIRHTKEQKEIIKFLWLQIFEDAIREKRLDNYRYDLLKNKYQNYKIQKQILDQKMDKDELEMISKFAEKINIIMSFNNFLELDEIINGVYENIR